MKIIVKDLNWKGSGLKLHLVRPEQLPKLPATVEIFRANAKGAPQWALREVARWAGVPFLVMRQYTDTDLPAEE